MAKLQREQAKKEKREQKREKKAAAAEAKLVPQMDEQPE